MHGYKPQDDLELRLLALKLCPLQDGLKFAYQDFIRLRARQPDISRPHKMKRTGTRRASICLNVRRHFGDNASALPS
jgi:hypothetical protein